MNYENLESEIAALLTAGLGAGVADVVVMPETEAEFAKPFLNARVTVAYDGSDYGDSRNSPFRSTSHIVQGETLNFNIIIQSRFRRGAKGVFAVFKDVKKILVGKRITHCDRMYLTTFSPAEFKEGIWTYEARFHCTSLLIEDYDIPDTPRITQIKVGNNVTVPAT